MDKDKRIERLIEITMLARQIRRVPHALHLIATVMTAGLWVFGWVYDVVTTRKDNADIRRRISAIRYDMQRPSPVADNGCPSAMTYYV